VSIYLDDEQIELAGDDLAGLLDAASTLVEQEQRLVIEVHVDGEPIASDQLEANADMAISGQEIRLYTAGVAELATSSLDQVHEALEQAKAQQERAGELLQEDKAGEALSELGEIISVWLVVQQAMMQTAALAGVSLEDLTADDKPFTELAQELVERLTELKDLIQNQDTVALSDVLQYEWPEVNDTWIQLVADLRSRVEA